MLAVIGAVLGGIWVAASAARESWRVSKMTEATMSVIKGVQRLNAGFTPNQLAGAAAVGTPVSILKGMYDAGVIPTDVFFDCDWSFTGVCYSLWGYNVSGIRLFAIKRANLTGEYSLSVWMSVNACVKITMSFLKKDSFVNNHINSIVIGGGSYIVNSATAHLIPISIVSSECEMDPIILIYFNP